MEIYAFLPACSDVVNTSMVNWHTCLYAGDYCQDRCERGHNIHHFNTRTFRYTNLVCRTLAAEISTDVIYFYMYNVRNNHDFMCMHLMYICSQIQVSIQKQ